MTAPRVLVTGATGFVGGAVCRHLAGRGADVHALFRSTGRAPVAALPVTRWHPHDGSETALRAVAATVAPEAVVHVAAHVPSGLRTSATTDLIGANLAFGTLVVDAAVAAGCRRFVLTSTYWAHLDGGQAVSLYAALKQAFSRVIDYYTDAHGLQAVSLALYDTYGPGDMRGKFVTLLCDAARTGSALDASDGQQALDLVHVDDVAAAYGAALDHLETLAPGTHDTYGVRTGRVITLRDLAALVTAIGGRAIDVRWGQRPRLTRLPDSPPVLPIVPGWTATRTLEAGLAEILESGHA